jgi:peptidoglycan/LPS O-acetylase OafA/YrhL
MHRFPTLDGLRATSILLVLAAHLLPLGPKFLQLNSMAADAGMAIFFALSGFLITETLLSGQAVRTFLLRRAARILPLAYAYLLFMAFIMLPSARTIADNFLFLQNYTFDWMLNGHFWSLCVEAHFYLAIALIASIGGARAIRIAVPLACLFITALRVDAGAFADIQTHLRVDEICAGGIIAILYNKRLIPEQTGSLTLIAAGVALLLCSHPLAGSLRYFRPYASAALLAISIPLCVGLLRSALVSRPAAYVAKISYALYVIHPITAHGFMDEGSIAVKYALKRPISILLTFVFAHLSTFYYEAPWIEIAKRRSALFAEKTS